ncbi:ATP-binding protein [Lunatibacter salilacus]|nr:AAA family ATPase [Lunatibacter salilacus]
MVLGYRGSGKTTLLLQHLSAIQRMGIYVSLDDFYFETHRLVESVESLYELGYRVFLLDEVHRYGWWSKDLKQLYDDYEDIQIIATGSSILDISKGNADLSRRASVYHLHGLSFREYLNFQKNINLPKLSLEEILNKHQILASEILDTFNFDSDFQNYMRFGYFPYFLESKNAYHQGISYLQKPEKIYLQNPNFIYVFSPEMANIGSVRETFFLNQLSAVHSVTAPKFGDFMVDDTYVFEVGGASKTTDQLRGIPHSYLALDIEGGSNRRVPLWLFGMLY